MTSTINSSERSEYFRQLSQLTGEVENRKADVEELAFLKERVEAAIESLHLLFSEDMTRRPIEELIPQFHSQFHTTIFVRGDIVYRGFCLEWDLSEGFLSKYVF